MKTLENGLKRYSHAAPEDRARALLYRAELALRLGDETLARQSLSGVSELELTSAQRTSIAAELAEITKLIEERIAPAAG